MDSILLKKNGLGIILCAAIAGVATVLSGLSIGDFSLNLIGAPVISIVAGMIISLAAPKFARHDLISGGVKFSSKKILQWAVIILGFSLNLGTIAQVGGKSLPVIISTIAVSLIVAFLMMKLLKLLSTSPKQRE